MNTRIHYPEVEGSPDFAAIEREVLALWHENDVFRASVERRKEPEFVFYDGPPFANGLPHYGHILTGFVKDIFARYQTMQGRRVERRFGWDCHGLPAEMAAEKELGVSGKQAIEAYGIEKFNKHCRESVMKYAREWEEYVTRQARWVDFKNDYKTMNRDYMESVMWAFKQLYDKGLVYESYRVMPYSWAMETPVSNFETRIDNAYREREDKAITVAFELEEVPEFVRELWPEVKICKVLAWTTTPWTLPSNLALGVNKNIFYDCLLFENECLILSARAGEKYFPEYYDNFRHEPGRSVIAPQEKILENLKRKSGFSGDRFLGLSYKPLFSYFKHVKTGGTVSVDKRTNELRVAETYDKAFTILAADFVSDEDGTGIVHLAPGFGEEDQKVCAENYIGVVCPVDERGRFTQEIFDVDYQGNQVDVEHGTCLVNLDNPRIEEGKLSGVEYISGPQYAPVRHREGVLSLRGLNVIADTNKEPDEVFRVDQVEKFGLANLRIIQYLKQAGALIRDEVIKHNYPHCWRTDTPLIYRALPSWYVEVTKFRDRMVELNQQINWTPEHVKDGLFGKWLENARDWSISRNRYWGAPIPVWKSDDPKYPRVDVYGSIAELERDFSGQWPAASGQQENTDRRPPTADPLHKPTIDQLTRPNPDDPTGKSTMRRVPDVFDCWFESGSMPYAQVHYPFENKEWFETHFPADFIVEYAAQTRGWFYTLMVLSTALFDKPPFLNCICHGVVLDESGRKLSKRLNNYTDPMEVFEKYGADAMRWFMMSSPVMRGGELLLAKDGSDIRDTIRLAIKPIWNAYHFFTLYANADGIQASEIRNQKSENLMDRYILAKCREAVEKVKGAMDSYDTPTVTKAIEDFFEVLNNWYIRRNRHRFWKGEKDADKQAAYDTLYTVLNLMCRTAAPLLPMVTEKIWQGLTAES